MKSIQSLALSLAHKIQSSYSTWSDAVKAAWRIAKIQFGKATTITFAKTTTGEVREAKAIALGSLSTIEKGFVRFVERIDAETTQWRSFKVANLIF